MLLSWASQAQVGLDSTSWKDLDVSNLEELKSLEAYYKNSFDWHPRTRSHYLEKLVSDCVSIENDSLICFYGEKLGVHYRELDSMTLSLDYLNLAKDHSFNDSNDRIILNSFGGLYRKYRDYELALEYYFKAADIGKKLNDGSEAYPLGNISEIYGILEDYDNAIKYLKTSLELSDKLKSPEKEYSRVYDYAYISEYFEAKQLIDSTDKYLALLENHIQILNQYPDQKYKDAQFVGYFTIAEINLKRGNHAKSKYFIDATESKAQSFYMSSVNILSARLEILKGNFQGALDILDSAKVREEYSRFEHVLELKAQCYEALENYSIAYKIKDELLSYQKAKFTDSKAEYMTLANAKYESLIKNEKIATLQQEQKIKNLTIKSQKYLVIMSVALSLLLIGLSALLLRLFNERKHLNDDLKSEVAQKKVDLKKANEELRIFNFAASHDLKEPLRTIGIYSKLLKKNLDAGKYKNNDEYFDYIDSSLRHSYDLVENIAKFSNSYELEKVQFEKVDLETVAQDTIKSLNGLIEQKNVSVTVDRLPHIQCNPSILYTVLKNLIENGIKFNQSNPPQVEIRYQRQTGYHLISVTDNGIGIESKYEELIFESFKRLHPKSKYSGSGLGLSISNILIKKLGGFLSVDSEYGNGSTFTIHLPSMDKVQHVQTQTAIKETALF